MYDGRQKSAEKTQASQVGNSRQVSATITDGASTIAIGSASTGQNIDQAVLQGALQGSMAVGEKRPNADSAGSQMSRRHVGAITTSLRSINNRVISRVAYHQYQGHSKMITGQCELDSHADTCVAGANCIVLETTD